MELPNFRDYRFGDYSGFREYLRDPDFFLSTFITPASFSLSNIGRFENFVIVGRKGTGKSSSCIALSHEKSQAGYDCTFFEFSNELDRSQIQSAVKTQAIDLKSKSIEKLFDSISEFYDFREIWKRKVFTEIAKNLSTAGHRSNFIDFATSLGRNNSNLTEGLSRGLVLSLPEKLQKLMPLQDQRQESIDLKIFNKACLSLLGNCHPNYKGYFFFDELNLSHSKSDSSEYETIIALVRDLVKATADLNDDCIRNNIDLNVVCCLRPEVRDAILQRDNELSKVVDSNFVSLTWPGIRGHDNPLVTLMKEKIKKGTKAEVDLNIILPKEVWNEVDGKNIPFIMYLLSITWRRPRDIMRILKTYQSTNGMSKQLFSKSGDQRRFLKEYSRISYQDIVAELEVKYSKEIIDEFFSRCRRSVYTDREDLFDQISVLDNRVELAEFVNDMFQAGVITNNQPTAKGFQAYSVDRDDPHLDPELRILIHRGIQPILFQDN